MHTKGLTNATGGVRNRAISINTGMIYMWHGLMNIFSKILVVVLIAAVEIKSGASRSILEFVGVPYVVLFMTPQRKKSRGNETGDLEGGSDRTT